jgi:hypothetical protein
MSVKKKQENWNNNSAAPFPLSFPQNCLEESEQAVAGAIMNICVLFLMAFMNSSRRFLPRGREGRGFTNYDTLANHA